MSNNGPRNSIDPALSLSLDVIRFGAALLVLFTHVTGKWLTGGQLWQLGGYGGAAVMIFFVLSGYVIAATTNPARGAAHYVAARASRLYSVVLPALGLTLVLDGVGAWLDPNFYLLTVPAETHHPSILENAPVARFILSGLFVQEWWFFALDHPGTNSPFWSLSYEATYYAAFGILLFMRGWRRSAAIVVLLLASGPEIATLAPLWFLGVGLWHVQPLLPRAVAFPALACAAGLVGLILGAGEALTDADKVLSFVYAPALVSNYVAGMATGLTILGLSLLRTEYRGGRIGDLVHSVADHTFELYLVHLPVAIFVVALSPFSPGDVRQLAIVYVAVIAATAVTYRLAQPIKVAIRQNAARRLRSAPAATADLGAPH